MLGTRSFSTTLTGYHALLAWITGFGELARIGVEGTGSYGAGLMRHLAKAGVSILEVDRPDRSDRRRKGKDDDLDAINTARAVLHQHRTAIPKSKDVAVEALQVLRVARAHAIRERRNTLQLLFMTIIAAPEELRDQVRNLTRMQLIRVLAAWRPDVSNATDPVTANVVPDGKLPVGLLFAAPAQRIGVGVGHDLVGIAEEPAARHRRPPLRALRQGGIHGRQHLGIGDHIGGLDDGAKHRVADISGAQQLPHSG